MVAGSALPEPIGEYVAAFKLYVQEEVRGRLSWRPLEAILSRAIFYEAVS
jgi:hypothetical protein